MGELYNKSKKLLSFGNAKYLTIREQLINGMKFQGKILSKKFGLPCKVVLSCSVQTGKKIKANACKV